MLIVAINNHKSVRVPACKQIRCTLCGFIHECNLSIFVYVILKSFFYANVSIVYINTHTHPTTNKINFIDGYLLE